MAGALATTALSIPKFTEPTPCVAASVNYKNNTINKGKRLTKEYSINYVVNGGSILCDYKDDAESVAKDASIIGLGYYEFASRHNKNGARIGEYYEHFHVIGLRIVGRPHIWYIYE